MSEATKYRKLDNFFVTPDRMPVSVAQSSKNTWNTTEASVIQEKVI